MASNGKQKPLKLFGKWVTLEFEENNPSFHHVVLFRFEPIQPGWIVNYNKRFKGKNVTISITEGVDKQEAYKNYNDIEEHIKVMRQVKLKEEIKKGKQGQL